MEHQIDFGALLFHRQMREKTDNQIQLKLNPYIFDKLIWIKWVFIQTALFK